MVPEKHTSLLEVAVDRITSKLAPTEQLRAESNHYISGALKSAGLFAHGKYAMAFSIATHALDSAKEGDSLSVQFVDAAIGGTKGYALKKTFGVLGKPDMNIGSRAVTIGIGSRSVDSLLTRQNYLDRNGKLSLGHGLDHTLKTVFDPTAIQADLMAGVVAHGIGWTANKVAGGAIEKSPFWTTVVNGGSFGMVMGAHGEVTRQKALGARSDNIDWSQVCLRAGLQGTADALASTFGGVQVDARLRASIKAEMTATRESISTALQQSANDMSSFLDLLARPGLTPAFATVGAPAPMSSVRAPNFYYEPKDSSSAVKGPTVLEMRIAGANKDAGILPTSGSNREAPASNYREDPKDGLSREPSPIAAESQVPLLPEDLINLRHFTPEQRLQRLTEAARSDDFNVRMLSVIKTRELAAEHRLAHFENLMAQPEVLNYPVNKTLAARYGDLPDAGRVPPSLAEITAHLPELANSSSAPKELIADLIDSMPDAASKHAAWSRVFDNPFTQELAVARISMLDAESRPAAWQKAWDLYSSEMHETYLPHQQKLANMLDILPSDFRSKAWSQVEFSWARPFRPKQLPALAEHVIASIDWTKNLKGFDSLDSATKNVMAEALNRCPADKVQTTLRKLLSDEHQSTRLLAVDSIAKLPVDQRWEAWQTAIKSSDYNARKLAITAIESLPSAKRADAISIVTNNRAILSKPVIDPETPKRRGKQDHNRAVPSLETDLPKSIREKLKPTAEAILLDQISKLPGRSYKAAAWQLLHDNPETKLAALGKIDALPSDQQRLRWSQCWNDAVKGSAEAQADLYRQLSQLSAITEYKERDKAYRRQRELEANHVESINTLLEVAPKLSSEAKLTAWDSALELLGCQRSADDFLLIPQKVDQDSTAPRLSDGQYYATHARSILGERMNKALLAKLFSEVPEHFPQDPRSRTGEWYRLHQLLATNDKKSNWSTLARHADFGLSDMIEHLPHTARESAWNALLSEHGEGRWGTLGSKIYLLPKEPRLRCFAKLCELPSCSESVSAVEKGTTHMTGDLVAQALELLIQRAERGSSIGQAVEYLPISRINPSDLNKTVDTLADIFLRAGREVEHINDKALRYLWELTPDNDSFDNSGYSEVRGKLVEKLPPDILCRILFEAEHKTIAERFAANHPDVIRRLARDSYDNNSKQIATLLQVWESTESLSTLIEEGLALHAKEKTSIRNAQTGTLIGELTKKASRSDQEAIYTELQSRILNEQADEQVRSLIDVARHVLSANPELARTHFLDPIETALGDSTRNYQWRLSVARGLSEVERDGMLGTEHLRLPDMRMRGIEIPANQRESLRTDIELALLGTQDLDSMLGDGRLGQLFPGVFGAHSEGGIVGRPQHGGHEFPVDEHTLLVVRRVRDNEDFQKLPRKDQINVLWAALGHDVGKRPLISDPGHEWASANILWGVLETLGYPPERIQRISNLIRRHTDVSFNPQERNSVTLRDDAKAKDLAVFYRHPNALTQLMALNSADIRSINSSSSLWTPEVKAELRAVARLIQKQRRILDENTIPLLTESLPDRFGVYSLTGDYGVLVHASSHLDSAFLRQLSSIESSSYSMSVSFLTGQHQKLYNPAAQLVAIIKAPPEHFSALGRENLGTGTNVDWTKHVSLAFETRDTKELAAELSGRLAQLQRTTGGTIKTLGDFWRILSQFDNLTELRTNGSEDLLKAYLPIAEALTTTKQGKPLSGHNEGKVISPVVAGFGLLRRGAPVIFEGFNPDSHMHMFADKPPAWFISDTQTQDHSKALRVPLSIWMEAHKRRLPIIALEPSTK